MSESSQKLGEHFLLTRSTFEEDLEPEQDIEEVNHLLVSKYKAAMFHVETNNDEVLNAVKAIVQSRWPEDKRKLSPVVALFFDIRNELVVQDGFIFRGDRFVLPKPLQKNMLQALHSSHQGSNRINEKACERDDLLAKYEK